MTTVDPLQVIRWLLWLKRHLPANSSPYGTLRPTQLDNLEDLHLEVLS